MEPEYPPSSYFWEVVPKHVEDDKMAKRFIKFLTKTWSQARADTRLVVSGSRSEDVMTEVCIGDGSPKSVRDGFFKAWIGDVIYRLYQAAYSLDLGLEREVAINLFVEVCRYDDCTPPEIAERLLKKAVSRAFVETAVQDAFRALHQTSSGSSKKAKKKVDDFDRDSKHEAEPWWWRTSSVSEKDSGHADTGWNPSWKWDDEQDHYYSSGKQNHRDEARHHSSSWMKGSGRNKRRDRSRSLSWKRKGPEASPRRLLLFGRPRERSESRGRHRQSPPWRSKTKAASEGRKNKKHKKKKKKEKKKKKTKRKSHKEKVSGRSRSRNTERSASKAASQTGTHSPERDRTPSNAGYNARTQTPERDRTPSNAGSNARSGSELAERRKCSRSRSPQESCSQNSAADASTTAGYTEKTEVPSSRSSDAQPQAESNSQNFQTKEELKVEESHEQENEETYEALPEGVWDAEIDAFIASAEEATRMQETYPESEEEDEELLQSQLALRLGPVDDDPYNCNVQVDNEQTPQPDLPPKEDVTAREFICDSMQQDFCLSFSVSSFRRWEAAKRQVRPKLFRVQSDVVNGIYCFRCAESLQQAWHVTSTPVPT